MLSQQLFWDVSVEDRRKKLLPFFWTVIVKNGQLFGNRNYRNRVNVSNLYKISYPGYSEMLTGYADPLFIPNLRLPNRNSNVLEYIDGLENYKGKVAVFSSWNVFPFILNSSRSRFPINSGYTPMTAVEDDTATKVINEVQQNVLHKGHTRYDLLTFLSAKEYILRKHPSVVMLGFGETDECAHEKRYDLYLQKAHDVDRMIAELWYFIQTDPFYKNNTTLIITSDHGRGRSRGNWNTHGFWIAGSGETWMAILGPEIAPLGEIRQAGQSYQKQLAATIARYMEIDFEAGHPMANPLTIARLSAEKNSIPEVTVFTVK